VVAYRQPANPQLIFVSRIIGMAGDHIQYLDRQLIVNGMPVTTTRNGPDSRLDGIDFDMSLRSSTGAGSMSHGYPNASLAMPMLSCRPATSWCSVTIETMPGTVATSV
jgi:hypothetical protein